MEKKGFKHNVLPIFFIASLALICLDAVAFLAGARTNGLLFVIGMATLSSVALISTLFSQHRTGFQDILVLAAGAAFFGWLAWKAFQ